MPRVDEQKKHNIRDILIARLGYELVYFDYDQIELRVLAVVSQDEEMLRILADPKLDIHRATAREILSVVIPGIKVEDVNGFNRQNCGKNVNFGTIYGSEGYRLVKVGQWEDANGHRHSITWDMLNAGMTRLKEKFTAFEFMDTIPQIARSQGNMWVTDLGRERRIGSKLNDRDEYTRKAAEREIGNFAIQSPAGGITIRTLNTINYFLDTYIDNGEIDEWDVFPVNTVHDSGTYEVREDLVPWFTKVLKDTASRPIPEMNGYRFPCKIGVGHNATTAEAG